MLINLSEIKSEFEASERRYLFQRVVERVDNVNRYMRLYNIIVPEVYCSVKVRIGPVNGSGKWMCNPFRIPEGSVVFSYGRHYEIFFELELRKITSNCCFIFGLNDVSWSAWKRMISHHKQDIFSYTWRQHQNLGL
ncbi:hypothetical protein ANCCEY_03414 [Ancylostoma ceylanicum]|uniref:Methyltransferase domain-containing protein n=1 Tax=Ancylostoma ceylanicum TaxID=53326 RepID=A0A0D6LZP2_9BILA|nr:hypothetical protein ANCCEY_03414 [Ancylostoma ceylanicum]